MSSMEDILANQEQLIDAIYKIQTNFKKDGRERKTADYIKRKISTLDNYWVEFNNNHIQLWACQDKSHAYFTENKYEHMKSTYENIKTALQMYEPMTESRPPTPLLKPATPLAAPSTSTAPATPKESRGTNSKTEDLLKKQASNFRAFHRTTSNINIDSITEKWELEDLLNSLQSRWSAIDSLHWEIDSETQGTSNNEYDRAFSSYEQMYNNIKRTINSKLWSVSHREKSTPQMDIPTFSGNYHQWTSFKDLFVETIHNNPSLSNAQKMQFLKGKVRGEADRLIQHLPISSDNYNICWEILNHRYNNKKLIFTSYINNLLSIPAVQQQSLHQIKRLHDTTLETINAIKNLGIDISTWDPLLVHLLSQKLDNESFTDYNECLEQPRELPTMSDFLNFLECKFTTMESSRRKQDSPTTRPLTHQTSPKPNKTRFQVYSNNNNMAEQNTNNNQLRTYKCSLCNYNNHGIYFCEKFLSMSPQQRLNTASRLKLCFNCLIKHQGNCRVQKRCRECQGQHNTVLHEAFASPNNTARPSTSRMVNQSNSSTTTVPIQQHESPEVLLATAIVQVQAANGNYYKLRALLDQGSQTSIITEKAAQILSLPRRQCTGVITGIGAKENNCKGIINITIKSNNCEYTLQTDVLIMKTLINNLPSNTLSKPSWEFLENIQLADPEFYKSRPVDLLLGAEVYSNIILDGICRENNQTPIAQQTRFGWILSGSANTTTLQCNVLLNNIEDIQRFWQIEDITQQESSLSSEDQACIEFYKATTVRREDGRYQVKLPLKPNFIQGLGTSKHKAIAQFNQLEQKFTKQNDTAINYKTFIDEYLTSGHMQLARGNTTPEYFLPHHCVLRNESTTTALRVVFNASAKTSTGMSLNDLMYRGPNLQQDLQFLILKWRQYKYAYTADIEKMFRQIWLNEEHQQYHKIVWRDNQTKPIQEYELTTVTYGTKAAPFLAMMTLKQLADDEEHNYQENQAATVLRDCFYMDDLIHGSHSLSSAKQLKHDLINLLKSGGFNLRKWSSNTPELVEDSNKRDNFDFRGLESTKALGLRWNPQEDSFTFESKIPTSQTKTTKRTLLSAISTIFDPLGWLSPLTVKLKLLFQSTWLSNIDWNDNLPDDINLEWLKIRDEIQNINQIKVQRWLETQENDVIELHGFCDASIKAYACVIYCKITRRGQSTVVLVAAKTRLVPVSKTVTLLRLELCGAVLLSQLIDKVRKSLPNYQIKTLGWTDSTAVLGWLQGDPDKWKTFVANRVKQVTEILPGSDWRYVKSQDNPADCASRGLTVTQLEKHSLWWQGPSWLHSYEDQPEQASFETEQDLRTRWYLCQKIYNDIWKRWRSEYLTQLTTRGKWKQYQENLKINDLVVIHDDNLPSGRWAIGRVVELHPGPDGHVRVVSLKTKNGYLRRPVVKLSLLPINQNSNQDSKQVNTASVSPIHEENKKRVKNIGFNFKSIVLALLYFMSILTTASCTFVNTPLKQNQGIYFDKISDMQVIRDDWTVVVYYKMEPYWQGMKTFENYFNYLEDTCKKLNEEVHYDVILWQLRHSYDELQHYNTILMTQHTRTRSRRRRGLINAVGSVANTLFGVLDEKFAEQYQKDITLIHDNEQHLASLWRNQTSIVEAEYNLLKRSEEAINKQHKLVNKHLIKIENAVNILNSEVFNISQANYMTLTAVAASNMIHELRNMQETLLNTVTDVYHGRFNFHLLSPEQLRNELSVIASQISSELTLPIENIHVSLQNIYHLLNIKARMCEDYLLFEIKVPLVGRDSFEIFHLIPVPTATNHSKMIDTIPISEFLAINLAKDAYITMIKEDISSCHQQEQTYLCQLKKPVYHLKQEESLCELEINKKQCKTVVHPCINKWVELNTLNKYLYFCCERCQLRVICADQVTAPQLEQAGLVSISHGCIVKSDLFTVHARNLDRNVIKTNADIQTQDISPINNIINASIPITSIVDDTINERQRQLSDIEKGLKDLKEQAVLNTDVSYHDVHQYPLIYIIIGAAVITAAWLAWRRVRRAATVAPPEERTTVRLSSIRSNSSEDEDHKNKTNKIHSVNTIHNVNKSTSPIATSSASLFS